MDDTDIETKFERGDVVEIKSKDERVDENIPWSNEFEILDVLIPAQYPDGQIKYSLPIGRPVCRDKIDRNYKLKNSSSDD
jgi:hypothetical protein